jgi:hypothetical protein
MLTRMKTQTTLFAAVRSTLVVSFAALCLLLFTATGASAQAIVQDTMPENEAGCGCHSLELETWEMSPHAALLENGEPVAACETCHGAYVRGHPDAGMIALDTDSSVCTDCHAGTAEQWEGTVHAEAGVQCIGCHVAHSQNLRLDDQQLCRSCHREALDDPLHTAHWLADATCTSCHLSEAQPVANVALASTDPSMGFMTTPVHDFVTVSAAKCLDCHREQVTTGQPANASFTTQQMLLTTAAEAPILRTQLAAAQNNERTLALLSPLTLGFGMSLGGLLGIAFVLVIVRMNRKDGGA